jgi:hypothetical protein
VANVRENKKKSERKRERERERERVRAEINKDRKMREQIAKMRKRRSAISGGTWGLAFALARPRNVVPPALAAIVPSLPNLTHSHHSGPFSSFTSLYLVLASSLVPRRLDHQSDMKAL